MSYTRHGVPTEGSPPDHKCKLNISSFLTLPHTLHCLICTKNIMITVLLQMMGEWEGCGMVHSCLVWVGGQGVGVIFFFCPYCLFLCCC